MGTQQFEIKKPRFIITYLEMLRASATQYE